MDKFKWETIYKQGMTSFYENNGKLICPFHIGSEESDVFERGWSQALKRHRGPLPGEDSARYQTSNRTKSLAEKYRNMRDWQRYDEE